MPKAFEWIKAAIYISAAILIFIFHETVMPGVAFLVGAVILAYAVEEFWLLIRERKYADLAGSLIQFVLAILLFIVHEEIVSVCIIWGVWSIIREGREMTHALAHIRVHRLALLNIAESVVVAFLSATMILEPGHHHAHTHVILLGIELILEILFPLAEEGLDRLIKRRKSSPPEEKHTEN